MQKVFNALNAKFNLICHLLALVGAHPIFHVSRKRVNLVRRCNSPRFLGDNRALSWRPEHCSGSPLFLLYAAQCCFKGRLSFSQKHHTFLHINCITFPIAFSAFPFISRTVELSVTSYWSSPSNHFSSKQSFRYFHSLPAAGLHASGSRTHRIAPYRLRLEFSIALSRNLTQLETTAGAMIRPSNTQHSAHWSLSQSR